ncbi:MAG: hypothetical protein ACFFC7_32665 [Candidatus Hermodarchaeota archaeon]
MSFLVSNFKQDDTYMFLAGGCLLLAIALVMSCIRYFYYRKKLVKYLKDHDPNLFQEINRSSFALSRFMVKTENTGDNVADVLKVKSQIARKYIKLFLAGTLILCLVLILRTLIKN